MKVFTFALQVLHAKVTLFQLSYGHTGHCCLRTTALDEYN